MKTSTLPKSDIYLEKLHKIRHYSGCRKTEGLSEEKIKKFIEKDPRLAEAVDSALQWRDELMGEFSEQLKMEEDDLCAYLQEDYVNFYADEAINPYVAIGAAGPWIITSHGAVLHDSGGYGMLGMGHAPSELIEVMSRTWTMANVMSPHFSQKRLAQKLKKEIGHTHGQCPFEKFICMNSGSEAVSVANRICDLNAYLLTQEGGRHEGKNIRQLSLEESFHGRTYRAAKVSHSTLPVYEEHLASFQRKETLDIVKPNDIEGLKKMFKDAEKNNIFYEAFFIEPVLGEGEPGLAITREFYDAARKLTKEHGTMLIVDSIQAALRAHGCLSIIDYPGFADCESPDCETYSKALNAGQYPLSVLAVTKEIAEIYVPGVYGNTMTTNPRALEVGCAVLDNLTDKVRENIRLRGVELKSGLERLGNEFPEAITKVFGTGLMVSAELNPDIYEVVGEEGFENFLRINGIAMIHGGANGLRFTPYFGISSDEVQLILDTVRKGIKELK